MQFLKPREGRHPFETTPGAARPDIFVFCMDMVAPELCQESSDYTARMVRPAWDGLRADSLHFANAFANSPLCGPSRAAMYTGRYPYLLINEERAHDGYELELRPDDAIYPEYLKATGYLTAHVGKSHVGSQKFVDAFGEACSPWNRWGPPMWDDPEYHAYLRRLGVDAFRFKREIQGLKPDRRSPGNSYGGWLEQADGRPFPIDATYPCYLVSRALEFLDSLLGRRDRQPIYLHLDLFAPHQPFFIPAGLEAREAALRAAVELPEGYREWLANDCADLPGEPKVYRTYRKGWGLYDEATARDYLIAHILQMEVIDIALGRFLDGLRQRGLYNDSHLLLTADHGEMNLERGLVDKGVYGHPKIAKIPLLWKQPDRVRAGDTIQTPVSLVDIAPTMLELAGVTPLARLDGESLGRRLAPEDPGREVPFIWEAGWHIAPNPAVAIHRYDGPEHHYRYVYNLTADLDELYDLNDPQARNRIDDPALAEVKLDLLHRLQAVLGGDPRWKCYWQAFTLDTWDNLHIATGDQQMLIPES